MKFRTILETSGKFPISLDPAKPLALVGSCFSANMAALMRRCLWNVINPFSTLYNPASIAVLLRDVISDPGSLIKSSLFKSVALPEGDVWSSWLLDSSFTSDSTDNILIQYYAAKLQLRDALYYGRRLVVTFGTAWVYRLISDRSVVANCHKQPEHLFSRERMTVKEIVDTWLPLLNDLEAFYPGLKVIFTISPVRYLKDGFEGNTRSKAVLQLAIEEICSESPHAIYFPAYEIMTDDLRDYRFYTSDLVHPSEEAIEYIWEKFRDAFVSKEGRIILNEGEDILRGLEHRPNVKSKTLERHDRIRRKKYESRLRDFHKIYPHTLFPLNDEEDIE